MCTVVKFAAQHSLVSAVDVLLVYYGIQTWVYKARVTLADLGCTEPKTKILYV